MQSRPTSQFMRIYFRIKAVRYGKIYHGFLNQYFGFNFKHDFERIFSYTNTLVVCIVFWSRFYWRYFRAPSATIAAAIFERSSQIRDHQKSYTFTKLVTLRFSRFLWHASYYFNHKKRFCANKGLKWTHQMQVKSVLASIWNRHWTLLWILTMQCCEILNDAGRSSRKFKPCQFNYSSTRIINNYIIIHFI